MSVSHRGCLVWRVQTLDRNCLVWQPWQWGEGEGERGEEREEVCLLTAVQSQLVTFFLGQSFCLLSKPDHYHLTHHVFWLCSYRPPRRLLKSATDKVQSWRSGIPEKMQQLKIGGMFMRGRGKEGEEIHRSSSEVQYCVGYHISYLYGEVTLTLPAQPQRGTV